MNKRRYFILFNRGNMGGADSSRFWTHRGNDDYVICFLNNGEKKKVTGYAGPKIENLLENKIWEEITEAEAALL